MPALTSLIDAEWDVRRAHEADASGLKLVPEAVARPACEDEVVEVVRAAAATRTAVTPAGGQTSTTGASVTDTGILLSLRGCDRIIDIDPALRVARVQAGAFVADVKRLAAAFGFTWAPDPTSEQECTVGGAIACNASGARTLRYGAARQHVGAVRVVLADGSVQEFRRRALEKNATGYSAIQDPVDWFVGSEGTLGVVVEAELTLIPLPERVVGLAIPFPDEASALAFVVAARESTRVQPRCLEYFDAAALDVARTIGQNRVPAAPDATLVYTEQPDATDGVLDSWLELAEAGQALVDDVSVFDGEAALASARAMRHAVPAAVIDRGLRLAANGGRRVSTDWAVPYRRLGEILAVSRAIAARRGMTSTIVIGHAGNGHPHQSYLAHNPEELATIEAIVGETLQVVVAAGGTIAAEHGIGKLKRRWLPLQLSPLQLGIMRAIKQELDPAGILAPGNVLP